MNASHQVIAELTPLDESIPINEPAAVLQTFAQKTGKTMAELEKMWDALKAQAKKKGFTGKRVFQFVVGVMKKILKVS